MKKRNFSDLARRPLHKVAIPCFRQAGFTLVELMMSIVLLAIGAALSLPSYREMVEKRQLTNGAEQVLAFVNSAQMESMKQNQVVTVSYARTADNNWCFGAVLGATACDCTKTSSTDADYCAINTAPSIINSANTGNLDLLNSLSGDGAYSFDPVRGIFTDLGDSLRAELSSPNQVYKLSLTVSNTGQAILCSKDSSHKVPGYSVCPTVSS